MKPSVFVEVLGKNGIVFFTGVPDSLLANLCAYINQRQTTCNHIIAANEGEALAIAAGVYLAGKKMSCVYMQNSGQGNVVNPLTSLCDKEVYSIPVLLVIGWRGAPGVKDEPQHVKQGKVTLALNDVLSVPTHVLGQYDEKHDLAKMGDLILGGKRKSCPVALVVPKGYFEKEVSSGFQTRHKLVREVVIEKIVPVFERYALVSTTGKISRELHDIREQLGQTHERDFLTVGAMGHASSIALGISVADQDNRVLCIDGDGAALMHMGAMAVNACFGSKKFKHIVLNNEAHESVGGQPTVAGRISLTGVAEKCGYRILPPVYIEDDLMPALFKLKDLSGPAFLEIFVALGSRDNLGRPKHSPLENKTAFMKYLGDGGIRN